MRKTKLKINPDYRALVQGIKDAIEPSGVLHIFDNIVEEAIDRKQFTTGVLVEVDKIYQYVSYQRVIAPLVDGRPDIKSIKRRYKTHNKVFFTKEYFKAFLH